MNFRIRPLRNEEDLNEALIALEELLELVPEEGSQEHDWIEVLEILVVVYQDEMLPEIKVDPVEVLQFHMERVGVTLAELETGTGLDRNSLRAVLQGKAFFTLLQIKKLSVFFEVPEEHFLKNEFRTSEPFVENS